jgi:CRISPR-associated endonuclease/helicase Cas3
MRTLVDQTDANVRIWLRHLEIAGLGAGLPTAADVHVLMGGVDEPHWYASPERPTILIGTQDMLLSRALMRGYAMSRFRWPVDFALLHNDAQWVFDEVQLMGAGLATSTQLEGFRRAASATARSIWVSATLDPSWMSTVDFRAPPSMWRVPDDFAGDASDLRVRALVDAPKSLGKAEAVPGVKKDELSTFAEALATEVHGAHINGRTTLVIVNTVARAQAVYAALEINSHVPLALIHSRFRPADRARQMNRLPRPHEAKDLIVVATQAIEAGVDLSAAVMFTELAPWASMVQRFGRANRYGELNTLGGAFIRWVDLPDELAAPYQLSDLQNAREQVLNLTDVAPSKLGGPGEITPPRRVIRYKDLIDLFDTDPDLTGFDVDISPYVRDANDTDVRVFWRDLSGGVDNQSAPSREELCAVPIGRARDWLKTLRKRQLRAWRVDPQARRPTNRDAGTAIWTRLDGEPWPGLVLMLDVSAGGYDPARGFDPSLTEPVQPVPAETDGRTDEETSDADTDSESRRFVLLTAHLRHVASEARKLCEALRIAPHLSVSIFRAAIWHDLGKAHAAFQARMVTDDEIANPRPQELLAKARAYDRTAGRPYFRHELASALAFLSHEGWTREADLVAYIIAAHHGKVRLSLRALPSEPAPPGLGAPPDGRRFARGVWEEDQLPALDLDAGEGWAGGTLKLAVMEIGFDEVTHESWTERARDLLTEAGPFSLAWAEALLRIADWRASAGEEADNFGE